MSVRCTYCDGEIRWHHLTGRDPQLRYLDPHLTLPLCHDHHQLIHDDLRAAGVDDPRERSAERLCWVERVERRLRWLAIAAGRLAASKLPAIPLLARLAESLKRLG